jgi:hypothetical protein
MDPLCDCLDIEPTRLFAVVSGGSAAAAIALGGVRQTFDSERHMAGLVDVLIPASGQAAAEALGLKVHRSVTAGARIRRIPRDEAEIAVECLRDWGISARVVEDRSRDQPATELSGTPEV